MKQSAIVLCLFISACITTGPTTSEQNLYIACRSVVDTQKALQVYKPLMSTEQRERIAEVVLGASVACSSEGDAQAALQTVRDALRELVRQQAEMEAANASQ